MAKKAKIEAVDTDVLKRDPWRLINKDPGFDYRCARNDPQRVQELEYWGYEVVQGDTTPDPESPIHVQRTNDSRPPAPPGMIWMRIPKELKAKREAAKDEIHRQHENDIKEQVRAFKKAVSKIMGRAGMAKLLDDDEEAMKELGWEF